jgi:hypothetical protein
MDTTVLTPNDKQTVVATQDGNCDPRKPGDTLLIEQSAWGHKMTEQQAEIRADIGNVRADIGDVRADIGSVKTDICGVQASIGDAKCEVMGQASHLAAENVQAVNQAAARSDVMIQGNFTANADRIVAVGRDVNAHVAHGTDVTREGIAKVQQELCDVRYGQLAGVKEITEKMHLCDQRFADLHVRMLEQQCEIKGLIRDQAEDARRQAEETRKQMADYRLRDAEALAARLQNKLDFLGRS